MRISTILLLVVIYFLLGMGIMSGQNCYEVIADKTGIETEFYQTELEEAACELIESFPEEFQDSFKIYSFGFYSQHDYMSNGYYQVWEKIKLEITSPYYLIFGKQIHDSRENSQLWIDLKLPKIDTLGCDREEYIKYRLSLDYGKIIEIADFEKNQIEAMKRVIPLMITCEICDNGIDDDGDGFIDCDDLDCVIFDNENINERSQKNKENLECVDYNFQQLECMAEYKEYLTQLGVSGVEDAQNFCDELIALQNFPLDEVAESFEHNIDILWIHAPDYEVQPVKKLAKYIKIRHDPPFYYAPDMKSGVNGDTKVLTPYNRYQFLDKPNFILENLMLALLHVFSDGEYHAIANKFMAKFKSGDDRIYEESDLSSLIIQTNEVKNKLKMFGKDFENKLKLVDGHSALVDPFTLIGDRRYIFSVDKGYLKRGPLILINDIAQIEYYLQQYQRTDNNTTWTATFYVEVFDHFGLDDQDLLNEISFKNKNIAMYQNLHSGFPAWWILQHRRGYKPFRTKIRFLVTLKGNL